MDKQTLSQLIENPIVILEDIHGVRMCHFMACGELPENKAGLIEYVGFCAPLQEVLDRGIMKYFNEHEGEVKQYYTECTIPELTSLYADFYDEITPEPISVSRISVNTPRGCYILVTEDVMQSLGLLKTKYLLSVYENGSVVTAIYDTLQDVKDAIQGRKDANPRGCSAPYAFKITEVVF